MNEWVGRRKNESANDLNVYMIGININRARKSLIKL